MKRFMGWAVLMAAGIGAANAQGLSIPLNEQFKTKKVQMQCDEHAAALGLPAGPFTVEYVNGQYNWFAVLPINGHPLVFSQVLSADGGRYAASHFVWWDVGARGIHLYGDDSMSGKNQTACKVVQ